MTLSWAVGGTALLDVASIDPKMPHQMRFVPRGLWSTNVLAVAGIAIARATIQQWGRVALRRLLLALTGAALAEHISEEGRQ